MTNSENLVWFWAQRYAEKLGWANGKAIGKSGPRDSSEQIKMVEERTAEKTKRGVTINIGQEALTYEKKRRGRYQSAHGWYGCTSSGCITPTCYRQLAFAPSISHERILVARLVV